MSEKRYKYLISFSIAKSTIYLKVEIKDFEFFNGIDWEKVQNKLLNHIKNVGKIEEDFFEYDEITNLIGTLNNQNKQIIEHILKYGKCYDGSFVLHDQYVRDLLNLFINYDYVYFLKSQKKVNIIDNYQRPKLNIEGSSKHVRIFPPEDKSINLYTFEGEKWYRCGDTIGKLISVYSKDIWTKILLNGIGFEDKQLYEFADNFKSYWNRYINFNWTRELRNIQILDNNLKIKLLIDYKNNKIKIKPTYRYGDFEFHYDDIIKKGPYIIKIVKNKLCFIKREPKKERRLFLFFFRYSFKWEDDSFELKKDKNIIKFLTEGFDKIPSKWNKKLTINFRKIRIFDIIVKPVFRIDFDKSGDSFTISLRTKAKKDSYKIDPKILKEKILNKKRFIKQSEHRIYKIKNLEEVREIFDELSNTFNFNYKSDEIYNTKIYFLPHLTQHLSRYEYIDVEGDTKFSEMYEEMTKVKGVKKVPIPDNLKDILRGYQKKGYYWLRFLHRYKLSGILADDMGLGKTLQAITLIKSIDTNIPSLVVCPKSLMHNWVKEFEKFTPEMNILVIEGTREKRRELINEYDTKNKKYDAFITSYSLLRNDIDFYEKKLFYFAILDEAQHIKNYKTKRARSVKKLNSNYRYVLTGTPMENSLKELWSIFDFIMPGYLGNHRQFTNNYQKKIMKENDENALEELNMKIKPFILRRTKDEVLKELPPKIVQVSSIPMEGKQKQLYKNVLDEMRSEIFSVVESRGYNRSRIHILSALTKLRQLCNHPGMIYPELKDSFGLSSKMDLLEEILNESIEGGHRILLFSQFVKMLHIIRNYLKKNNIKFEYMDGKSTNRLEIVENFNNNEEIPIFLVSLKAGGTGLNITGADTVIHFDPWWNPMVERQASDRVHRIGQTKVVNVYKFITENTVEEKIIRLQEEKKDLFKALDFTDQSLLKTIDWNDLKILFE